MSMNSGGRQKEKPQGKQRGRELEETRDGKVPAVGPRSWALYDIYSVPSWPCPWLCSKDDRHF